jgi:hypothetical protein
MEINTEFCFFLCEKKGINCEHFEKLKKAMEGIDGFSIVIVPFPKEINEVEAKELPTSHGYSRNYVGMSCEMVKKWTTEELREYFKSTSFAVFVN